MPRTIAGPFPVALPRWIHTLLTKQDKMRAVDLAVCFVLHEAGDGRIIGFYTLSAIAIEPASIDENVARRFGHYRELPATLIGRLAVDRAFQGQRIGGVLLADAAQRALAASKTEVGSALLVVDALDDRAASSYVRFGFRPLAGDGSRLYLPMASLPIVDAGSA